MDKKEIFDAAADGMAAAVTGAARDAAANGTVVPDASANGMAPSGSHWFSDGALKPDGRDYASAAARAAQPSATKSASSKSSTTKKDISLNPGATYDSRLATGDWLIIRALRWIFVTVPVAIWRWIKSIDIVGLANMALLAVIIVMFGILLINILDINDSRNGRGGSALFNNAIAGGGVGANNHSPSDASDSDKVVVKTTVTAGDQTKEAVITLPLRKNSDGVPSADADKPVSKDNRDFVGDIILDGSDMWDMPRVARPGRGANIDGNLFVQNMHQYTLPCGIKITGDLILRNVGMVRFCGAFSVGGDVRVTANSSFGPFPADASIAGNVIF